MVEDLYSYKMADFSCGTFHTIAITQEGLLFTFG